MSNRFLANALTFQPFGGAVTVLLFGKPDDWTITTENDSIERIDLILAEIQKSRPRAIRNIYAPRVADFNARICRATDLRKEIPLHLTDTKLWRGDNADGTMLENPGDAFWASSADCPTVITRDPKSGLVIAAHAGRNSLIDQVQVAEKKPYRAYQSVVDAIVACHSQIALKNLRVFITCGISSTHFTHPYDNAQWGEHNKKMCAYILTRWGKDCLPGKRTGEEELGRIALSEIIRSQCGIYDIPQENIGMDGIDTYGDTDVFDFHFWSHRRGDGAKRNGVLVVRNR